MALLSRCSPTPNPNQVLTYSANDKAYRVWEMTNYEQLYRLPEEAITENPNPNTNTNTNPNPNPDPTLDPDPSPSPSREQEIAEIKISPGIMLLILSRREGHVPLKILSVEDGATLHRPNHLLEP